MGLAIDGWKKTRDKAFEPQDGPGISFYDVSPDGDPVYLNAVKEVLKSEILSGYRGNSTQAFWGGKFVKKFEREVEEKFKTNHAIACNSATSGLWMACAAIGLQPGDEVIVTPWSMSCSASIPLLFGAIPIFADINRETYCLDFDDMVEKVTHRTKAIIVVDLFGLPFDERITKFAKDNAIYVIEDAAQAIGATRHKEYAGCLGDIGVFSFTQGKHLTAGEGGCCLTNSEILAAKLSLARNHAEAVSSDAENSLSILFRENSMVGMNLRMTEIQAAILSIELRKLDKRIRNRLFCATRILSAFKENYDVIDFPSGNGYTNSLYCLPIKFNDCVDTISIAAAIRMELVGDRVRLDRGVPVSSGYIKPLYKMPVFKERKHWAFNLEENKGHIQRYDELSLPNVESLQENGLIITLLHSLNLSEGDLFDIESAITKVGRKRYE